MLTFTTILTSFALAQEAPPSATMTKKTVTVEVVEEPAQPVPPAPPAAPVPPRPAQAPEASIDLPRMGHVSFGIFGGGSEHTGIGGTWFETRGAKDRGFDIVAMGFFNGHEHIHEIATDHGGHTMIYEQEGQGFVYGRAGYQYDFFGKGNFDLSLGAYSGLAGTGGEDMERAWASLGIGGGLSFGVTWHPGRFRFGVTAYTGYVPVSGEGEHHELYGFANMRVLGPLMAEIHTRSVTVGGNDHHSTGIGIGFRF